jgi:putative ABC transport system permease protein
MKAHELWEFFKVALQAILLHRLRSALTALGIIIGVASVIVMSAIGNGASKQLQQQMASMGTRVPGIAAATGSLDGNVSVIYGAANWSTGVSGTHAEYQDVRPWPLLAGRWYTAAEVANGAKVVVLGSDVVRELFAGADPVGEMVRINNIPFEVIGTLTTRGSSGFQNPDDRVFVPITTARSRLVGRRYATVPDAVGSLALRIADDTSMEDVQSDLPPLLRKLRRIGAGEDDNFMVTNFAEMVASANQAQSVVRILLATTAAMSLVVGGIGIMNIMLVSVTERTREIGLRMAVGARPIDVMSQFLTEAIILCMAGGLIGLLIGVGLTVVLSVLFKWTVAIGVGTVLMAILVSAGVGIIFGFVPARRASHLNPIDALRYE